MKASLSALAVLALLVVSASVGNCLGLAHCSCANVSLVTSPISTVSLASPSITMQLNFVTSAGQQPSPATCSAFYNITTNEAGKKLIGQLSSLPPAGMTACGGT